MTRILVTGGTGMLGTAFTASARKAGHRVRIASRRPAPEDLPPGREWARADLTSQNGLQEALDGVDMVVHAATARAFGDYEEVDVAGTHRLLQAASSSSVRHLIYPSIVGVDEIPLGYYQAKRRMETEVLESELPTTVVRATQFHAFVLEFLGTLGKLPLMPVPAGFLIQSVSGREFAEELLRLLETGPRGKAPDFAGPEVMELPDMAREWIRIRGRRRWVLPLPLPGKAAKAFREGAAINRGRAAGRIGWVEWLGTRHPTLNRIA